MREILSPEGILVFWLMVARIGGLIFSAPLLGSPVIPRQVKVALALTLSFLMLPEVVSLSRISCDSHPINYTLFLLAETGLGLIMGYTIKLIFVGVELSGQIIGIQMGLGMAEFFDPQSGAEMSIISRFNSIMAMLIFISINGHLFLFKSLMESFVSIPPGSFIFSSTLIQMFAKTMGSIFVISLKAGIPVILTLLLVQIVMGVINRVIPQINIFMISIPLKILIGLFVLGFSMPHFLYFLEDEFGNFYSSLISILKMTQTGG